MTSPMQPPQHRPVPPPPRRQQPIASKVAMTNGVQQASTAKSAPLPSRSIQQQPRDQASPSSLEDDTNNVVPNSLQEQCSQLHASLIKCSLIELQSLANQLQLDYSSCQNDAEIISLIENFSRNANSRDDATTAGNNEAEQTGGEILDRRSHLHTQLSDTLQTLSLLELQNLAMKVGLHNYHNVLHDECMETSICVSFARAHITQLILDAADSLPVLKSENDDIVGGENNDASGEVDENGEDDTANNCNNEASALDNNDTYNDELSNEQYQQDETSQKKDSALLANSYREYLQTIRNGGYESLLNSQGEDENETVGGEINITSREMREKNSGPSRQDITTVDNTNVQSKVPPLPRPPPPPRLKTNQRPPPPPPPKRKSSDHQNTSEVAEDSTTTSVASNMLCLDCIPTAEGAATDSNNADISTTSDKNESPSLQLGEGEEEEVVDEDMQEEFLDAISLLASQINESIKDIVSVDDDNDVERIRRRIAKDDDVDTSESEGEFDMDSLIPTTTDNTTQPASNTDGRLTTEEIKMKERYKEYLALQYNNDDESVDGNESGYKMHMKQVVSPTKATTIPGKSKRRTRKQRKPKALDILSSVNEDKPVYTSGSESGSESTATVDSQDDIVNELTERTSRLVASVRSFCHKM